jgi:hypothetical protein
MGTFPSGRRGFLVAETGGGGGAWGTITGTLSAQLDLQAALDLKLEVGSGYWSPLTNGDPITTELVFVGGDTIDLWVAT